MAAPHRDLQRPSADGLFGPRWLAIGATLGLLGFTLAVSPSPASAGEIHPALRDQLERAQPSEMVSAIFVLEQQTDLASLDTSLKARRATRQDRHREVILALQQTAQEHQAALLQDLAARQSSGDVVGFTPYWIANLVVVHGRRQAIEELAARNDVSMAEVNFTASLIEPVRRGPGAGDGDGGGPRGIGLTPGVRACRANEVWHELGIWGDGALVANLDTGVDGNHPALNTRWRGYQGAQPWQECWRDVLGTNTQFPTDTGSHGTHVMGSITGLGVATVDSIGVAPGATWIAANAINQGVGGGFDNDVIDCYQWFADPDGNAFTVDDVPDVLQNSWRINEGFGGNYTDCDTRWWAVIDGMEAAGVVVTFSAGNEGPGAQTIGSPPDRATTATNGFSIGAVDATNFPNFPWPIASFSSRGPTGCSVAAPLKIKPEICGPGVDVYSSVPGGGYQSGWSGTSMSGPHVAGVVGLMRSINPDIDVDTVKEILMDTARDEGTPGEDNTYGWGMVDAFEAVTASLTGYGTLTGTITNASNGGSPIAGAKARLVELNRQFTANALGVYSGNAAEGVYTVEATHPSFATGTVPNVSIVAGQITVQNFALVDVGAPVISNVRYPLSVENQNDPIPVVAAITDFSALTARELHWRVENGSWNVANMNSIGGNDWQGDIPGHPIGTTLQFYIAATDAGGNTAQDPIGAPLDTYEIFIVQGFYADDVETENGWLLSQTGDAGVGRWVRVDPVPSTWLGDPCAPGDDHTPAPGVNAFVTGQGVPGGNAGSADVDNGCVTLRSPIIDLSDASEAIVSYWRWFAMLGTLTGNFEVAVSNNGGLSWTVLENVLTNENSWQQRTFDLGAVIGFSNQMRFRFKACDTGASESLVEGGVDDFVIQGVPATTDVDDGQIPLTQSHLFVSHPNPAQPQTTLRFRLGADGNAKLSIYDANGRRVRSLVSGRLGAGDHQIEWDGRDDAGHTTASGVYLYRLEAGDYRAERKLLMLR